MLGDSQTFRIQLGTSMPKNEESEILFDGDLFTNQENTDISFQENIMDINFESQDFLFDSGSPSNSAGSPYKDQSPNSNVTSPFSLPSDSASSQEILGFPLEPLQQKTLQNRNHTNLGVQQPQQQSKPTVPLQPIPQNLLNGASSVNSRASLVPKKEGGESEKQPPKKKRKRVLNYNPNSIKSKFILTEEQIAETDSEQIDKYIEELQKNSEVTAEELKEVKKQRRRIRNREYAKNKRSSQKEKTVDFSQRVVQLEKENEHLREENDTLRVHLQTVLSRYDILKHQLAIVSGNKVEFSPPNLPMPTSSNPATNNKTNMLFVFVILFSFGLYFNLFAGLLSPFSSSTAIGSSRVMLGKDYHSFSMHWLYFSMLRVVPFAQNLIPKDYTSLLPQKVPVPLAGFTVTNATHMISYIAFEDTTWCFYERHAHWVGITR